MFRTTAAMMLSSHSRSPGLFRPTSSGRESKVELELTSFFVSEENLRARYALNYAKLKAPHSSNKPGVTKDIFDKVQLMRITGKYLFLYISKYEFDKIKAAESFYRVFLRAVFAEAFQCGNCAELGALAFVNLMETGITGNTELLDVIMTNARGEKDGHVSVVLNREEKSNINNPKTWGKITLIDPWGRDNIVHYSDKSPTMKEIQFMRGDYVRTDILAKRSQNMSAKEWTAMIDFLRAAKSMMNLPILKLFLCAQGNKIVKSNLTYLASINRVLDAKIELYLTFSSTAKVEKLKPRH